MMLGKEKEKLPVSEFYKVIDYTTIFKSGEWWEAVIVFEASGRRSIGLYLWHNRNGTWKRKHKFTIRNLDEWGKVKKEIERLAPKLASK